MAAIKIQRFSVMIYIIRNLRKNRTRTFLTISAIGVCVALFVLFNSLGAGLNEYISDNTEADNIGRFEEMEQLLSGWLDILTSILVIILGVAIANTMLMAVSERQHEIGTLKAIGFSRGQIHRLILLESLVISGSAFVIGCSLGISLALVFDRMFWQTGSSGFGWFFTPALITAETLLFAALISVVVGTVASIYPAVRAASLKPAEALRYE